MDRQTQLEIAIDQIMEPIGYAIVPKDQVLDIAETIFSEYEEHVIVYPSEEVEGKWRIERLR